MGELSFAPGVVASYVAVGVAVAVITWMVLRRKQGTIVIPAPPEIVPIAPRQPRFRMNLNRNMRRGHERFRLAVVDTEKEGKTVLVDATSWPTVEKAEALRRDILSGKIGYGIIVEGTEEERD